MTETKNDLIARLNAVYQTAGIDYVVAYNCVTALKTDQLKNFITYLKNNPQSKGERPVNYPIGPVAQGPFKVALSEYVGFKFPGATSIPVHFFEAAADYVEKIKRQEFTPTKS